MNKDHVIKKQVLEVEFPDSEQGHLWHEKLEKIYWNRLLPLIQKVCDNVAVNGEDLAIEYLEIDLGEIPVSQFEQELGPAFQRALSKELSLAISRAASVAPSAREQDRWDRNGSHLSPHAQDLGTSPINGKHKGAPLTSDWQVFQFYITHGYLPWWVDGKETDLLNQLLDELIQELPQSLRRNLPEWWKLSPIRYRLVHQFTDQNLLALTDLFATNKRPEGLRREMEILLPELPALAAKEGLAYPHFRQNFWDDIFYLFFLPDPRFDLLLQKLRHMQRGLDEQEEGIRPRKNEEDTEPSQREGSPQTGSPLAEDAGQSEAPNMPSRLAGDSANLGQDSPLEKPLLLGYQQAPEEREARFSDVPSANFRDELERFQKSEEIYVNNAGLVILWPFLTRFFTEQGLVEDRTFIDDMQHHRALYWLQSMAEGPGDFPEFLLPLNKVLAGIPLAEAPIIPNDLKDWEHQACEDFLKQVIATAPILHNMSVAGFRGTFLMREGILKHQVNQWSLIVKRETYDLVLDRLPWPYNYVKLPWMEKLISVEW